MKKTEKATNLMEMMWYVFRMAVAVLAMIASAGTSLADNLAERMQKMGDHHFFGREYDFAESYYRKALEHRRNEPPSQDLVLNVVDRIATCCEQQENYDDAIEFTKLSLSTLHKLKGPSDPMVAGRLVNLGRLHRRQRNFGDAEEALKAALAIHRKTAPGSNDVAETLTSLSEVYGDAGKDILAMECLDEAIQVAEANLGKEQKKEGYSSSAYALKKALEAAIPLCRRSGNAKDAAAFEKRLAEVKARK